MIGEVVQGGLRKPVASRSVIIGGVKKSVTFMFVIVGGVKKIVSVPPLRPEPSEWARKTVTLTSQP